MKQIKVNRKIKSVSKRIHQVGGQVFVVGGAVRDAVMGKTPDDVDFMVCGISTKVAKAMFNRISQTPIKETVQMVSVCDDGEEVVEHSAPVFVIRVDGEDFEIAMARIEVQNSWRKQGFDFVAGANITVIEDMKRRDFTCNAMAINIITGEFIDPFGGREDIKNGIMRAVSEAFSESPDRAFRGVQQASRMGFEFDDSVFDFTEEIFKDAVWTFIKVAKEQRHHEIVNSAGRRIPVEQIWKQMEKMATKAIKPSIGIEFMQHSAICKMIDEIVWIDAKAVDSAIGKEHQAIWVFAEMIRHMSDDKRDSFFAKIGVPMKIRRRAVEFIKWDGPKPERIIEGGIIIQMKGIKGKAVGIAVEKVFMAQFKGEFDDFESGKAWVEKHI